MMQVFTVSAAALHLRRAREKGNSAKSAMSDGAWAVSLHPHRWRSPAVTNRRYRRRHYNFFKIASASTRDFSILLEGPPAPPTLMRRYRGPLKT